MDLPNIRFQVLVDAFKELCFETSVDFKGGEFYEDKKVPISLRYEKLFGYCELCSSLCHKDDKCPLGKKKIKNSPEKKRETKESNGGWYDGGKHDDRARSYKGVVINGNQYQQHKERDGRDYYGKGKGRCLKRVIHDGVRLMTEETKALLEDITKGRTRRFAIESLVARISGLGATEERIKTSTRQSREHLYATVKRASRSDRYTAGK